MEAVSGLSEFGWSLKLDLTGVTSHIVYDFCEIWHKRGIVMNQKRVKRPFPGVKLFEDSFGG